MTETDVPALKFSFLVTVIAQEGQRQEGIDEVRGRLKLGL